ncbi:MAG: hypothetical protein AAB433_13385 [Nitrospirota bacterium]
MSLISSSLQTLREHGDGETHHPGSGRGECRTRDGGRRYVLAHFDRQVLARKLTDVMQHVVNKA